MEKLLYFWVDKSHKRATNSTGIRANWTNCLLYILKVLLNLHNFALLNINCTEPYLGPLYISYIVVQILNCKIPERVLLNGAICKRFSKVSRRWRCAACHLLQVFYFIIIIIIIIIFIIIVVVVVVDDDTDYWVYLSSDHLFQVYYKVWQLFLLQSTMVCYYKVRQLFYYKVRQVLLQSATGITKCDSTPHPRRPRGR